MIVLLSISGNECDKVMTGVAEGKMVLPQELAAFSLFIISFKRVIDSCLRIQLGSTWEQDLESFSDQLDTLKRDFNGAYSPCIFIF